MQVVPRRNAERSHELSVPEYWSIREVRAMECCMLAAVAAGEGTQPRRIRPCDVGVKRLCLEWDNLRTNLSMSAVTGPTSSCPCTLTISPAHTFLSLDA